MLFRAPLRPSSFAVVASILASVAVGCGDDTGTGATAGSGGDGASGGDGGASSGGGGATAGGGGQGGGEGGTGGTGGGEYQEVDCNATLMAPSSGVCGTASGGTSGILLRGTVLGPDALYRGGGVLVDDAGIIQCAGCDCETEPGGDEATIIDCPDGVISPGLINPHDHITYAHNPPYTAGGNTRYEHRHEWRRGANGADEIPYLPSNQVTANQVLAAELRFVMSGVTSAASAGGEPGLMRNVDTSDLESLPIKEAFSDTFPLDDVDGTLHETGCDYGNGARTSNQIANETGYLPHIAEGISHEAQNEFNCTSDNGVQNGHDLIAPQTAIIHAVGMYAQDFGVVQTDFAAVIWSPRSNISLYGDTARVTMIDALGVPIALGTDWLISGSMNIMRELRCADELNQNYMAGHFSDLALWRMVTENAAFAVGAQNAIGMLRPGYIADIAVFDGSQHPDFRAILDGGVEDVALVLRGGEPLYGDSDLLDETEIGGAACEEIDVCNVSKKVCAQQDTGISLAAIRAAGEGVYPLFFCAGDEVVDEPTCVPYRSTYPDGITDGDADGDGVPDGEDICPDVFDPIRSMDDGEQADADADGIGDSCDKCPLDSGESCTPPRADDVDGDGILNGVDLCPELSDDGADMDSDGKGDACDACPDQPNPGGASCAFTIQTIRDPQAAGHPPEGAIVEVTGFVTAIRPSSGGSRGFTIQDGTGPYSGVFVFTGNQTPAVQIGNEVRVSGTLDEYGGQTADPMVNLTELSSPTITVIDNGTTLPFSPIDIAASATLATPATAEPYESMLVKLDGLTIAVMNADGGQDFDEFAVTTAGSTNLRVNDQFLATLDNTCAVGTTFDSITAVVNYSFNFYKIEPRSDADIVNASCDVTP